MTSAEGRRPDDSPSPVCRIWGYISRDEDTVVFTARDRDAARRRVVEARRLWGIQYFDGTRARRKKVKSIDGFEMMLDPIAEHLVPKSYRVWIGDDSFEWPQPPLDPDDDDPIHAEARMPIPVYSRVSVRTPEKPPSWTRRTATLASDRGGPDLGRLQPFEGDRSS